MAPRLRLQRARVLLVLLVPASLFFSFQQVANTYLFPSFHAQYRRSDALQAHQDQTQQQQQAALAADGESAAAARYDGSHQGGRVEGGVQEQQEESLQANSVTAAGQIDEHLLQIEQRVEDVAELISAAQQQRLEELQDLKRQSDEKQQQLIQEYFHSQPNWNWSWPTHSLAYKTALGLRTTGVESTNAEDGHARQQRQEHVESILNTRHLEPFPLDSVRLKVGSPYYDAMLKNGEYLLNMLDADKLLASFRVTAGLEPKAQPYCEGMLSFAKAPGYCWEAPDCELRGHFLGHYLSALSIHALTMHSRDARLKANHIVKELAEVQKAISKTAFRKTRENTGTRIRESSMPVYGFVSAFPESHLTRFENMTGVWAPVYTLHKVMQGLFDAHFLLGSVDALRVLEGMANHLVTRVDQLIISRVSKGI